MILKTKRLVLIRVGRDVADGGVGITFSELYHLSIGPDGTGIEGAERSEEKRRTGPRSKSIETVSKKRAALGRLIMRRYKSLGG